MSDFRIELTTLHRPSGDAVVLTDPSDAAVDYVRQFSDPKIKETLNEQTEFSFNLSMYDPMVQHVITPPEDVTPIGYAGNGAYAFACRVYYRNQAQPCFWAPCTFTKRFSQGVVEVSGVDVVRAQSHYLRLGDLALTIAGDDGLEDEGLVTVDYSGIQTILQAVENTAEQDDRDVPSWGFSVSREAGAPDRLSKMGVERSQEVWETVKTILEHRLGPDLWIDFRDDVTGKYGIIRIYGERGSDRTTESSPGAGDQVRWYYNVAGQADNVADVVASPLPPITHAHVVASDQTQIRETAADALESYLRGVFVSWTAADMNTKRKDETVIRDALKELAQSQVDAYASAPEALDVTLRPDAGQSTFWREHFWVGDTVYCEASKGYCTAGGDVRIRSVEVSEQGPRGLATTKVELAVDLTSDDDGEEG